MAAKTTARPNLPAYRLRADNVISGPWPEAPSMLREFSWRKETAERRKQFIPDLVGGFRPYFLRKSTKNGAKAAALAGTIPRLRRLEGRWLWLQTLKAMIYGGNRHISKLVAVRPVQKKLKRQPAI